MSRWRTSTGSLSGADCFAPSDPSRCPFPPRHTHLCRYLVGSRAQRLGVARLAGASPLRCRQVQVIRLYDEVPIRVSRHMAYR